MYSILIELITNSLHPNINRNILMTLLTLSNKYHFSFLLGLNQWYNCYNKSKLILHYVQSQNYCNHLLILWDNIKYNKIEKILIFKSDFETRYNFLELPAIILEPDKNRNPNNNNYTIFYKVKNLDILYKLIDEHYIRNKFS